MIWLILLITLLYLPILTGFINILNRGNDLENFFWPITYYVKHQILQNHTFPLWNNLFLSGTPLLPDPQSPLFYLPNVIFLLFPIDFAFLLSIFVHIIIGSLGAYWLSLDGFKFSKLSSIFTAIIYVLTPRLIGYMEAGHVGLILAHTYFPFILLALLKLQKLNVKWVILLTISLAGLFYTHTITFLLSLISTAIFLLSTKKYKILLITLVITFGLTAITLLPQYEWQKYTSRVWITDIDVYPKWNSVSEFIMAVFWPWNNLTLVTEKWIALGIIPIILAFIGFWQIRKKYKIISLGTLIVLVLVALNNASPIYKLLSLSEWYGFLRVSTRIWFIPVLTVIFLAGYGIEVLSKRIRNKSFINLIAILAIIELATLAWMRLNIPLTEGKSLSTETYKFLSQDHTSGMYRIFCLDRCLSQKESVKYNLELTEGYSTLSQSNYYRQMWQFTGQYWNYYTLSLPPIGIYQFTKIYPDTNALGEYNVKYIISPYELKKADLTLVEQFNNYLIYKNNSFKSRAYYLTKDLKPGKDASIIFYSPNKITVDTRDKQTNMIILAEVWSPGWKAYLNGQKEAIVQERPDGTRMVNINDDTNFVDFIYLPESFKLGSLITLGTIFLFGVLKVKKQW
jgi:hypothetical protein